MMPLGQLEPQNSSWLALSAKVGEGEGLRRVIVPGHRA